MKKILILIASILVLAVSYILISGNEVDKKRAYLQAVLKNLNQIKSATYLSKESASAPGDTIEFNTFNRYYKEYANPADPTIGSSFAWFKPSDTTKMEFFYDGKAKGHLDWDERTISIDSFQNNKLSFRPIGPPFFNYTKSIIKYALETKDSISIDLKDFGDSIQFSLCIYDEVVEFFGNDLCYTDLAYIQGPDITSKYDIWINKSDNLPYRLRRRMPHNTSFETCRNVKLSKGSLDGFLPSKYFPADFSITSAASAGKNRREALSDLVGKVAPEWILKDVNNNTFSLKELKSKIVMLQFTGVGCGPCHESIPFLKQLVSDYKVSLR